MPRRAPPITSLGKCRPSRIRSRPTITATETIATTLAIRRLRRRTNRGGQHDHHPAERGHRGGVPAGEAVVHDELGRVLPHRAVAAEDVLMNVVARPLAIITPAVKIAARRWPRMSSRSVTITVRMVIPMVPMLCRRPGGDQLVVAAGPVAGRFALVVDADEWLPLLDDQGCDHREGREQAALMPRFHARGRSITRICRVGSAWVAAKYAVEPSETGDRQPTPGTRPGTRGAT